MYSYRNNKKNVFPIIVISILLTVIGVMGYVLVTYVKGENISYDNNVSRLSQEIEKNGNIAENKDNQVEVIKEAMSFVVGISIVKIDGTSIFLTDGVEKWGSGTGIIVSSNGFILTNQHVVGDKNNKVYVTLEDGSSNSGNVVWVNIDLDLAIVKINKTGLNAAKLVDSDDIKVGEQVFAIGNPLGFEFQRTVTSGIVSAVNRTIKIDEEETSTYMEDLIQTDASINPGNSGGPLINLNGEVMGVNTIKIDSAEGIGFAIPINIIKPIINKFVEEGIFKEAYIGIFAHDKEVIPYLNSKIDFDKGIYVTQIDNRGPCGKVDLKIGDIIIKLDGEQVNKMVTLRRMIYEKESGDKVVLTILRNNKERTIEIVLGEKN